MRYAIVSFVLLSSTAQVACSDSAGTIPDAGGTAITDSGAVDATDILATSTELDVPVPSTGLVYINLSKASLVTPSGDPKTSGDWDIAFEGYDIFTNSGSSGAGKAGAFGPLDIVSFVANAAPDVPFISPDQAGGAFINWYAYEGTKHVLYSRFHVYGVKHDARLWKVQVLGYYGKRDDAPTSAVYQLRYAEVTSAASATQTIEIDGTAGGVSAPATAPSGCIDLASGTVSLKAVTDIQTSTDWDLCFRRDAISVNGEVGGPGAVGAIDLAASGTASETLQTVEAETADTQLAAFNAVDASSFANAVFRGDHVVSAFERGGWLDPSQSTAAPANSAWLALDATGLHKFLLAFSSFESPTTTSPGTVVMHIKPVQ